MEENKNISKEEAGNQVVEQTSTTEENTSNNKTFSQEDVDKIIQRRISEERAKLEKEKQEEVAKATELAQLDSEAREKKLAELHEQEIAERDKALSLRENRLEAINILANSNIPINLVDFVITEDKDKTLENANNLVKVFNEQVSVAVAEKLKGEAPTDIASNENLSSISEGRRVL